MPVILDIKVQDRSSIRGLGRAFGRFRYLALVAAALDWHERTLPRHFSPGNESRYHFEKRSQVYRKIIKPRAGVGQGKFVSLTLKGRSARFLQSFYTVGGNKNRVLLRMRPPTYFTNPFIGTFKDPQTGKTKRITQQPNKPAEATTLTDEDRLRMKRVAETTLVDLIRRHRSQP